MKIRITTPLPVEEHIRPEVGGVYDVEDTESLNRDGDLYFIRCNGERVGVYARECEIVREGDS